ncbi:PD-(D/E)XK nuclease family protein (plasmid) [Bradyrhizobium lupini]|uniref:PD-(D/E)XK nuclease family protein n=1 Tax=Rhizobium lupini TaxID=136996 RepID=UPI00366FEDBE
MEVSGRRTIVAHGRLAMRELRLAAARERHHGLQIMTFEQVAARLAGGLARPVDDETLRSTVQAILPSIVLGQLDSLKSLPGMVGAATDTLRKAWRAGVDLQARAGEHPRIASIASIEDAVLAALPPAMMRPTDLVATALQRLDHVGPLFGPIEIVGITELSPCWRPLLHAIAARVPVRWTAGPRSTPTWLDSGAIDVARSEPHEPEIVTVSASTAYHEAIEALRWARQLIASGTANPAEIAIASVTPADYDDHFLALRADANLDLHFVHGVKITACREGQAAAALADVLVRGLSQTRMRRLGSLLTAYPGPFQALPEGWTRVLPADAPLASPQAWVHLLDRLTAADWPDEIDHGPALRKIMSLLSQGISEAEEISEALLHGRTLAIWRKALLAGPAASLDLTLETLKQDDGPDACASVAWMPASALAASPRRFVRLLGLNSSRWPRGISEDRLLSEHIIPTEELDPLPVSAADRRDFATILATSERQVVLSRARRDSDGRLLGRSTLLQSHPDEIYLRRNRVPDHAFSETDRLMARPQEFRTLPQAAAATTCWRNWLREEITPHDGLVRADHPVVRAILARTQSASSLRQLLRNPLGFVWHYGLRWRASESGDDPLVLDTLAMGDLVHMTLDRALSAIEANGGLAVATAQQIASTIDGAVGEVAEFWETERPVPPRVIWRRTLDEARELSQRTLAFGDGHLAGTRAFGEVPFGGAQPKTDAVPPWDPAASVEIPGTGFRIAGYIDRLDISGDGRCALVRDYKTGRKPKDSIILDGGKELQRCLYAFAVKAMLGDDVTVSASLLYPRDEVDLRLEDPEGTLVEVVGYLRAAHANLLAGGAVLGADTGGTYDDLAFALPANSGAAYCKRKIAAATERLGAAAQVWEAP